MTNKVHIALFQILRDTLCSVTRYTKTTPIRATLGSKISSCSNATRTHERTHTHTQTGRKCSYIDLKLCIVM